MITFLTSLCSLSLAMKFNEILKGLLIQITSFIFNDNVLYTKKIIIIIKHYKTKSCCLLSLKVSCDKIKNS